MATGNTNRTIIVGDDEYWGGHYLAYFNQVLIAKNLISTVGAGGTHIYVPKPSTVTISLDLQENVYLDSSDRAVNPVISIPGPPYGGSGDVEIKGFYGRQSTSAVAPVADSSRYSQGDIIWNSARTNQKSPLGYSHITGGKLTPIFGAGMGFRATAFIKANDGAIAMPLLIGLPSRRFRVLEVSFFLQGASGGGTAGSKSLMIRSNRTGTNRLIASVSAADIIAAAQPRIPDTNVVLPALGSTFGLGALHEAGQGIEVVGMPDTTDATAIPVNLTLSTNITITVAVLGVME